MLNFYKLETKSVALQLDDLSLEKGTATIAHAVYDNIDLVNDIARKGMFGKSWNETKMADDLFDVDFYVNHDPNRAAGSVIRLFEDTTKAYTQVKAGTHTEGVDALKMMDEKIARKASFGFQTIRANIMKNGKGTRELKEVRHLETSILTKISANPKAGVVSVVKSMAGVAYEMKMLSDIEQQFVTDTIGMSVDSLAKVVLFAGRLPPESDLYTTSQYWVGQMNDLVTSMKQQIRWNGSYGSVMGSKAAPEDKNAEIKAHLENLHKFVRNTTASDNCIKEMDEEIKSLELALALNTADTQDEYPAPSSSEAEMKALSEEMLLLTFKHFDA